VEQKNRKTNLHEGVSAAMIFPFSKEVSQKSFVLDAKSQQKDADARKGRLAKTAGAEEIDR